MISAPRKIYKTRLEPFAAMWEAHDVMCVIFAPDMYVFSNGLYPRCRNLSAQATLEATDRAAEDLGSNIPDPGLGHNTLELTSSLKH